MGLGSRNIGVLASVATSSISPFQGKIVTKLKGFKKFGAKAKEGDLPLDLSKRNNHLVIAQRTNDIIQMVLDGKSSKEITKIISDKFDIIPASAYNLIVAANKEIMSRKQYELDDLINSHVDRYEEIYAKLTEIKAFSIAMTALKQKEKLIGLHKNGTHMRVVGGNISSVSILGTRTYYDPKRLTEKQQERLEHLLGKVDVKSINPKQNEQRA